MVEAMRDALRRRVRRLKKRLANAKRGDPDGVHDSRTELRRTRAELELMGRTVFDRDATHALAEEVRRFEKALADSRDTDVLLDDLRAWLRVHPRDRSGLAALLTRLERRRDRAAVDVRRGLAKKKLRALFRSMRELVDKKCFIRIARAPNPSGAVPELVRHFAHEEVWHRYDAVMAYDAKSSRDVETLHALRSACRFLRFSIEDLGETLPGLEPIATGLRALQEQIGRLHDDHVAIERIERWVRRDKLSPTPALNRYLARRKRRMHAIRARFEGAWLAVLGERFRRQVALAAA